MQREYAQQLCAPIETPRLLLEPLVSAHADMAFGPMQDDAIYEWISMNKPRTVESLRANWERLASRLSTDGADAWPVWAITRRSDGELVGEVDAVVDDNGECTNLGYYLFPAFWGQGFASEVVNAITDHLVRHGIHRLVATVTVGNHASVRVLKKAGFAFTRILPDNDTLRGVLCDDEEYVRVA